MTGFILGFLLATNKELQDVDVVVMDNYKLFPKSIWTFCKSSYLKCDSNGDCTVMEQERKILQMTTNLSLVEESANNDISGGKHRDGIT
ncbi:BBT_HP_G0132220.mRNA.1.CDS.1 [Saccharomyces cerevisiae]|nr:BBT_HP_G0132220.mRNA.1.CDS.1 [Saccharomyces cerevisiae]CAI6975887.1 BBT_HP_G0132220.mRNA.1.CDS.1 [Saccharomyces cerevisiae]